MSARNLGGYSEARFLLEALAKGFIVNRPFIDNRKYDFLLDKKGIFYRVQVKSTNTSIDKYGSYKLAASCGSKIKTSYTKKDIDVMAFYIKEIDVFYLIPVELLEEVQSIRLHPNKETSKYFVFKNNWNI